MNGSLPTSAMVARPLRERMIRRDDQGKVVVVEVERLDLWMLGEAGYRDMDLPGDELLDSVFGQAGGEVDVDARPFGAELAQHAGQHVGGDRRTRADADAADVAVADRLDCVGAFLDRCEGALSVGHECVPRIGQGDAAAGAFEQAVADLTFQGLDAGGDGWLCQEERFSGAAE